MARQQQEVQRQHQEDMMSKMTDEELERALEHVAHLDASMGPGGQTAQELRDHIVALAGERDALRARVRGLEGRLKDVEEGEAATFRREQAAVKRMQALEGEVREGQDAAFRNEQRALAAESRLAAIRQRLDKETLAKWLTRFASHTVESVAVELSDYLLGEDTTEAPESPADMTDDEARRVCACSRPLDHQPEADCYPTGMCGPVAIAFDAVCIRPTGHEGGHDDGTDNEPEAEREPSTAEARRKEAVRRCAEERAPLPPDVLANALQDPIHPTSGRLISAAPIYLTDKASNRSLQSNSSTEPTTVEDFATVWDRLDDRAASDPFEALSRLERRMGAMARALRQLLDEREEGDHSFQAWDDASAALTDAPEVFTLEEVEDVLAEAGLADSTIRLLLRDLKALRK